MARPREARAERRPEHGPGGATFGACCMEACLFGWREAVVDETGHLTEGWVTHLGCSEEMAARLWREMFPSRDHARRQLRRLLDMRPKAERDRVWALMREAGPG